MPIPEVQFAFQPMAEPDVAIATARIAIGSFFAISGFHKLVVPQRHQQLKQTLVDLKIPFIRFNEWFVPGVEFAAGIGVAIGLLTVFNALLLGAICLVATCTDGLKRIREWKPINKADWFNTLQYLPEVTYGILVLVVVFAGPDRYSLDRILQLVF